jgi:multicomponent Na+:H+ antiporter subunit F
VNVPAMATVATVLIAVLALPLALAGYRMIKGPGYADRFVALDMLTAVAIALAALTTLATGRSAFLDIGLGIALINFVSTCAFAAFLNRKREDR